MKTNNKSFKEDFNHDEPYTDIAVDVTEEFDHEEPPSMSVDFTETFDS